MRNPNVEKSRTDAHLKTIELWKDSDNVYHNPLFVPNDVGASKPKFRRKLQDTGVLKNILDNCTKLQKLNASSNGYISLFTKGEVSNTTWKTLLWFDLSNNKNLQTIYLTVGEFSKQSRGTCRKSTAT